MRFLKQRAQLSKRKSFRKKTSEVKVFQSIFRGRDNNGKGTLLTSLELLEEKEEIRQDIALYRGQLQTALDDDRRKELKLALEIARLKLEINGYKIDLENAATDEERKSHKQDIKSKEVLLHDLNVQLQQQKQSSVQFFSQINLFDKQTVNQLTYRSLQSVQSSSATDLYSQIGDALREDQVVVKLMADIAETRNAAVCGHHFYLVDGPSGIGKTQLPFVFRAAGVRLCHLLMTVDCERPQDIYKPLMASSKCFTSALVSDVHRHFGDTTLLETGELMVNIRELQTVGVIFALLGVVETSWTVFSLSQYVERFEHKDQLPIFFLDEVLPHYDHRQGGPRPVSSELRLARNLLRAVGLVPVLMGTNSSAANFISAAFNSRCGEARSCWCKLVTRLPRPNTESLQAIGADDVIKKLNDFPKLISICPFLTQQFQSCIPWFIELFVKVVDEHHDFVNPQQSATEFLDKVLCEMANKVFERKGAFHIHSFRRAQFCYHLEPLRKSHGESSDFLPDSSERSLPEEKLASREDRTVFVSSHFASLDDEDCDLFIHGHHLSKDKMTAWLPRASFQRAKEDSFLYLMLGDGNQRLPFPAPFASSSSARMTTLETFWSLTNHHNRESSATVVPTDKATMKLEGADLEVIGAVAVEVSSHRGGLGGIDIADFLLQLATELLPSYRRLEWSHQLILPEKRVPYLSAEGDSWPEVFRQIQGVYWGHLSRAKDLEQIDLKILTAEHPTQPEISAECKHYKNNLDGVVLRQILERIPKTSWLHLVICTHMQANYWTKETKIKWKQFREIHGLEESAILRVMKQGSKLTLQPLFPNSAPQTPPSKLVVFFPFRDWIPKKKQRKK